GDCARRGILLVAAVGNQGCECPHVPAALDAVLAVGAMDESGEPLPSSNWGGPYGFQGILAPGVDIVGAQPGGGTARGTGTSYATALVSGIAALLLSWQRKLGRPPRPLLVRAALLRIALGCAEQSTTDCRRLLAGRLNVNGAVSTLARGMPTMSDSTATPGDLAARQRNEAPAPPALGCRPPHGRAARGLCLSGLRGDQRLRVREGVRGRPARPHGTGERQRGPQSGLPARLGLLGRRGLLLLPGAAGADGAPGVPLHGGRQRH